MQQELTIRAKGLCRRHGRRWVLVHLDLELAAGQALLLAGGTHAGPLGIDNVSVPVPGGLGTLQFFLQVVEGDPSGVAAGASNITTTILQ